MDEDVLERLRGVTAATVSMQLIKRGIRRSAMVGPRPLFGWSGERIEIQNDHWAHQASNGSQWLELDAELGVDSVHQNKSEGFIKLQ